LSPIAHLVLIFRKTEVLLDTELAVLYDVPTKALNQAVKRNRARSLAACPAVSRRSAT
jgi:hypothetical protein